jgi:hypothetical protein
LHKKQGDLLPRSMLWDKGRQWGCLFNRLNHFLIDVKTDLDEFNKEPRRTRMGNNC